MENRAKGKNFMENIDFEPCRAKLFLTTAMVVPNGSGTSPFWRSARRWTGTALASRDISVWFLYADDGNYADSLPILVISRLYISTSCQILSHFEGFLVNICIIYTSLVHIYYGEFRCCSIISMVLAMWRLAQSPCPLAAEALGKGAPTVYVWSMKSLSYD